MNIAETLQNLIADILGNRDAAVAYAEDPMGSFALAGISPTDPELAGLDMPGIIANVASCGGLTPAAEAAVAPYTSAPAAAPAVAAAAVAPPPMVPPMGQPPLETIMQHINYVTYATYEGDEYITQEITNIDNSTNVDVEVDGDVYGDIDLDTEVTNVNATGDGAVAAGRDVENAVTGDGSVLVDGDNYGQINTGDGAVQAGGDIEAPVNTGTNTGIIANGPVDQAVVGDNNQTVQNDGDAEDSVINFGDGDVTNFGSAGFSDTAVAVGGGDATNVSDNYAEEGSAIAAGNAAGTQANSEVDISDSFNETNFVDADNSVVNTAQGQGEAEQDSSGDIEDFDSVHAEASITSVEPVEVHDAPHDMMDTE